MKIPLLALFLLSLLGGGCNIFNGKPIKTEDNEIHGFNQSIEVMLSPLSITILKLGD